MEKFFALKENKQTTIINASLSCFGRYGYDKASINDIAVEAGISKASVFQYFGSKKQLYAYLLDYAGKTILESFRQEDFNEDTDLFDRVLASSFMEAKILEKNPYLSQFIVKAWTETADEVHDTLAEFRKKTSTFRKDFVLQKSDMKKFKNPNDAEAVSQILMLMAEGYVARFQKDANIGYNLVMEEFQNMMEAMRRNFYKEEYLL